MPLGSLTINFVCLSTPEQVACYYKHGKVRPSIALKSLLPEPTCSAVPRVPPIGYRALTWLFEERADELSNFSGDKTPFLCLFKVFNLSFQSNSSIRIGKSGSGAMEVPDAQDRPGDGTFPGHSDGPLGGINIPRPRAMTNTVPIGNSQSMPALENLQLTNPEVHTIFPPRIIPLFNGPQIVHIVQPGASSDENTPPSLRAIFDRLYPNRTYKSNPDKAYKYADNKEEYTRFFADLSDLSMSEINKHGAESTEVVMKVADITYPISYVSSIYPDFSNTEDPLLWSMLRPEMAFSSPIILHLKAGDVLFINQSFKSFETTRKTNVPMIFDLAVCTITQWLEDRGVTVLFSTAGSKDNSILNVDLNDLIGQYNLPSPLPGIIVGGLKSDKSAFTSNYGSLVNCYGLPVQLADGTSFEASSAATAYVAGLVVRMQRYAKSKGHLFFTPSAVKGMLTNCGDQFTITTNDDQAQPITGNLPNWDKLKLAIDQTFPPGRI